MTSESKILRIMFLPYYHYFIECMKTEASLRAEYFYNENAVPHAKKQLANALKHYKIDK